jgi:hypothetical protein
VILWPLVFDIAKEWFERRPGPVPLRLLVLLVVLALPWLIKLARWREQAARPGASREPAGFEPLRPR